jgi:hypothetical protein
MRVSNAFDGSGQHRGGCRFSFDLVVLNKHQCGWLRWNRDDLGRGELGHGLGSLGDGVLGELAWEHQTDGGLDLPGGQGWLLVHAGELGGLGGDLLELISDERVQDGHGLGGNSSVWVDLLEDLEDVELVALDGLPLLLSVRLDGLSWCLSGCHC